MRSCTFLLLFLAFASLSCNRSEPVRKVNRCFYYWKTVFNLTDQEQDKLADAGISKLYIRYFDVDWDEQKLQPVPVSHIRFNTPVKSGIEVVPTVFITNRTLKNLPDTSIAGLAARVSSLIAKLGKGKEMREVQLDCDWTESTADKYFSLIDHVRAAFQDKVLISSTIRLHQVKYFEKTGVPPADHGMLMFYNMGKLEESATRNSIFDEQTARAYLVNFSRYPLKLDVALPLFSWGVVLRKDKVAELMNDISPADLEASPMFEKISGNRYKVRNRGYFRTYYLYRDDVVRMEQVDENDCRKAAGIIAPYIKGDSISVSIFHLDKNKPFFHDKEIQEDIFSVFN